jgi:hypothetical protein
MNHLLRPRIWLSFLASSGVGPCDVPFRYASASILDFGSRILSTVNDIELTVQISRLFFDSHELFSRFSFRNPRSAIRIRRPGGPPASPERAGSRPARLALLAWRAWWRAGTPILFALAALPSSLKLRRDKPLSPASGFPVSWSHDNNS